MLTKINAGTMIGAGTMLALGIMPRLASATLAATLIPTTAVGHDFWNKEGQERQQQETQFLKNLAIFGGLLAYTVSERR